MPLRAYLTPRRLRRIAVFAALIAAVFTLDWLTRPRVDCDRARGTCEVRTSSFPIVGARSTTMPVDDLLGAYVKETRGRSNPVYRVVLKTAQGSMDSTSYSSNDQQPKLELRNSVELFARNKSLPALRVEQRTSTTTAGMLVGVGLLMALLGGRRREGE